MRFIQTTLTDAYIIEPDRVADERGFFARTWCQQEFAECGLDSELSQCNISFNHLARDGKGNASPTVAICRNQIWYGVRKARSTMSSSICALILPTFKQWTAIELTAENLKALYVPKGFAHGFQTLTDDTSVFYQMSGFYQSGAARGFRWNDPTFKIDWPLPVKVIADRDRDYPDYSVEQFAPVVVA